jgi:hypothetical protein
MTILIIYICFYWFIYIQYLQTHTQIMRKTYSFCWIVCSMRLLDRPRHGQQNVYVYTVFISLRIRKWRELFEQSNHFKTPVRTSGRAVYGRSPAENVGSNRAGGMDICREFCVLSGRGLCDQLITCPEESHSLRCVVMCDLGTSRIRRP